MLIQPTEDSFRLYLFSYFLKQH